jgi:hypothetical protein
MLVCEDVAGKISQDISLIRNFLNRWPAIEYRQINKRRWRRRRHGRYRKRTEWWC